MSELFDRLQKRKKKSTSPSTLQLKGAAGSTWRKVRRHFLEKHVRFGGWYECAMCHRWTQEPEVDHIIKRSVRPDLIYDETNFQILDHACHQKKDGGMR